MTTSGIPNPLAATEATTERIRALNEQIIGSAKTAGQASLDAYEKALQSLVDFEQKATNASQLEWVSAVASAHAKFVQDVSAAYVSAARATLK
ncbi:MAG: hypothetical protein ACRDPY_05000 [Streptosporangiaceae bacterium]